ncbi:MAG: hypothetical protein ACHQEM_09650 [Chitinophagales bacterium]
MRLKKLLLFITVLLFYNQHAIAQITNQKPVIVRMSSTYTSFPDTGRANGHEYDGILYDAKTHYNDSSVIIVIPPGFIPSEKIDFVFWFHGWRNSIDSSLVNFHISDQFVASGKNAILVLAETAKNAPDTYGGKLQQPMIFSKLVNELISELSKKKIISVGSKPNHIILAGHSGGFGVMAYIIKNGGLPVQEIELFDALYGHLNIFQDWILANNTNRFINLYTNQGATDETTMDFMHELLNDHVSLVFKEESGVTPELLASNRVSFLHSTKGHNEIITHPDNFRLFLEASPFLSKR